jgi:hypothetical protein
MRNKFFLRVGADSLDRAIAYRSRAAAIAAFRAVAGELDRYGQSIEATVHIAPSRDLVDEYPDFVLSLGPRGGVRVDRA